MYKRYIPVLLVFCALGILTSSAGAATAGPGWRIDSLAGPTNFSESENSECPQSEARPYCDHYEVTAMNAGSEPTDG